MLCYVVIDTNVLVSALISKNERSATVTILDKVLDGTLKPIFSQKTIKEYKEVLIRPKFGLSEELVAIVVGFIEKIGICIEPEPTELVFVDKDDAPFYELLCSKKKEGCYLVTGNLKHFPQESDIMSPSELINHCSNRC